MVFDLKRIVRPKIYNLEPYRCARDDFTEGILLDANENAHGPTPVELSKTNLHLLPRSSPIGIQDRNDEIQEQNKQLCQ